MSDRPKTSVIASIVGDGFPADVDDRIYHRCWWLDQIDCSVLTIGLLMGIDGRISLEVPTVGSIVDADGRVKRNSLTVGLIMGVDIWIAHVSTSGSIMGIDSESILDADSRITQEVSIVGSMVC